MSHEGSRKLGRNKRSGKNTRQSLRTARNKATRIAWEKLKASTVRIGGMRVPK